MKRTIWIGILLLCIGINKTWAQNDPVLAGMILLYTDKAEKELKNQEKVMLIQTTGLRKILTRKLNRNTGVIITQIILPIEVFTDRKSTRLNSSHNA